MLFYQTRGPGTLQSCKDFALVRIEEIRRRTLFSKFSVTSPFFSHKSLLRHTVKWLEKVLEIPPGVLETLREMLEKSCIAGLRPRRVFKVWELPQCPYVLQGHDLFWAHFATCLQTFSSFPQTVFNYYGEYKNLRLDNMES